MNRLLMLNAQVSAAGWKVPSLVMPWFAPIAILLGIIGSWTGLTFRQATGNARWDFERWGFVLFFWIPLLVWVLVQFTPQV